MLYDTLITKYIIKIVYTYQHTTIIHYKIEAGKNRNNLSINR